MNSLMTYRKCRSPKNTKWCKHSCLIVFTNRFDVDQARIHVRSGGPRAAATLRESTAPGTAQAGPEALGQGDDKCAGGSDLHGGLWPRMRQAVQAANVIYPRDFLRNGTSTGMGEAAHSGSASVQERREFVVELG